MLQAMLAVTDLFYAAAPEVRTFFHADVRSWLDEARVRHVADGLYAGQSGYTHTLDCVVPGFDDKPERMLMSMNSHDEQGVRNFIVICADVIGAQERAKPYAVLNDTHAAVEEREIDALRKHEITPVLRSRRKVHEEELAA